MNVRYRLYTEQAMNNRYKVSKNREINIINRINIEKKMAIRCKARQESGNEH